MATKVTARNAGSFTVCFLGGYCVGTALGWALKVWQSVPEAPTLQDFASFGDALAPAGIALATLALLFTVLALFLQRKDIAQQIQEMRETTSFQGRREIHEAIVRLRERICTQRTLVGDVATSYDVLRWNQAAIDENANSATTNSNLAGKLAAARLHVGCQKDGDEHLATLAKIEQELFEAVSDADATRVNPDHGKKLSTIAKWLSDLAVSVSSFQQAVIHGSSGQDPILAEEALPEQRVDNAGDEPQAEEEPADAGDEPQAEKEPADGGDVPQAEEEPADASDEPQAEKEPVDGGDVPQPEQEP